MKFIKLHGVYSNRVIILNAGLIASISNEENQAGSFICMCGDSQNEEYHVGESPEEVIALIEEGGKK